MRRLGLESVFCLAALWHSAPLLGGNEITLKGGTKFAVEMSQFSISANEPGSRRLCLCAIETWPFCAAWYQSLLLRRCGADDYDRPQQD